MPTVAQIVQRNQEQVDHIDDMLRGLENEFALPVSVPTEPKLTPPHTRLSDGEVRAGTADEPGPLALNGIVTLAAGRALNL